MVVYLFLKQVLDGRTDLPKLFNKVKAKILGVREWVGDLRKGITEVSQRGCWPKTGKGMSKVDDHAFVVVSIRSTG